MTSSTSQRTCGLSVLRRLTLSFMVFSTLNVSVLSQIQSPIEKELKDDGSVVYRKKGGWPLPSFKLKKLKTEKLVHKLDTGRKLALSLISYRFVEYSTTTEPFATAGIGRGAMAYNWLDEYKIGKKTFCYKISFSEPAKGTDYFFAYYDEDGDGEFESLVLDEKSGDWSLFGAWPHLPTWVMQKSR